jgi:hypothetical protein
LAESTSGNGEDARGVHAGVSLSWWEDPFESSGGRFLAGSVGVLLSSRFAQPDQVPAIGPWRHSGWAVRVDWRGCGPWMTGRVAVAPVESSVRGPEVACR